MKKSDTLTIIYYTPIIIYYISTCIYLILGEEYHQPSKRPCLLHGATMRPKIVLLTAPSHAVQSVDQWLIWIWPWLSIVGEDPWNKEAKCSWPLLQGGYLRVGTIAIEKASCFRDKIHMFSHQCASFHIARPNTGQTNTTTTNLIGPNNYGNITKITT